MKIAAPIILALIAWGWLVHTMAQQIKHPQPPASWCWVGQLQFGLPCKYRSRAINV